MCPRNVAQKCGPLVGVCGCSSYVMQKSNSLREGEVSKIPPTIYAAAGAV